MADFKTLSNEMRKLKNNIETVLFISGYRNCDDLSELDDYKQINTADNRQKLREYQDILCKLDVIQSNLEYLEKPIKEVGKLCKNNHGRYQINQGYCYTCGSGIEFLRVEEVYNYDTDTWEDAEIWTCSRIESQNGNYYIVGYPDIELNGLTVRIRE